MQPGVNVCARAPATAKEQNQKEEGLMVGPFTDMKIPLFPSSLKSQTSQAFAGVFSTKAKLVLK